MVKNTVLLFFLLSIIASLLIGINLGKKIGKQEISNQQSVVSNQLSITNIPTYFPTETPITTDTLFASPSAHNPQPTTYNSQLSTYTDKTCGFSFFYPGSYINQQTVNEQSVILTDPASPDEAIATTCASVIPRPPLTADKIESILLDGAPATLYHDKNDDGTLRDEVIVKNPNNNLEIIIAGYGSAFQKILKNFRFVK